MDIYFGGIRLFFYTIENLPCICFSSLVTHLRKNSSQVAESIIQAVGFVALENNFSDRIFVYEVTWYGSLLVRPNHLNLFYIFTLSIMLKKNFKQVQSSKSIEPISLKNIIVERQLRPISTTKCSHVFDNTQHTANGFYICK